MKTYVKPSIAVLTFAQKEQVAADCRFCYAGYEDGNCTTTTVCWVDGGSACVPDEISYGVG